MIKLDEPPATVEQQTLRVSVGIDTKQAVIEVGFSRIDSQLFQYVGDGLLVELGLHTSSLRLDHGARVAVICPLNKDNVWRFVAWVEQSIELALRGTDFVIERRSVTSGHAIRLPSPRRSVCLV